MMTRNGLNGVPRDRSGYTLMELVIVILILGIVGALSVRLLSSTMSMYQTVMLRSRLVNAGRSLSARLYREAKPIPFADSLLTADAKALEWKNNAGNTYQYTITGSQVTRTLNNGSPKMLVEKVDYTNSAFTFYDSTGAALTPLPLNSSNRHKVRMIGASVKFTDGSESVVSNIRFYLTNLRRF